MTTKWRTCERHGDDNPNVWGCPECLRELRAENDTLKARVTELESATTLIDKLTAEFASTKAVNPTCEMHVRLYAAIHAPACEIESLLPPNGGYISNIHWPKAVAKARFIWADALLASAEQTK